MQHAKNTKTNDAVTNRQVQRFLQKPDVPNPWKSKLKNFKDIIDMPIFLQDKLFAYFISQQIIYAPLHLSTVRAKHFCFGSSDV